MTWTKETALAELAQLKRRINGVKDSGCMSAEHVCWHSETLSLLKDVFGIPSPHYQTIGKLTWSPRGHRVVSDIETANEEMAAWQDDAFRRDMEIARGTLQAAQRELARKDLEAVRRPPPERKISTGTMPDPDPKKSFSSTAATRAPATRSRSSYAQRAFIPSSGDKLEA